ncbi:hypothetical protein SY88_03315 [Clostridiales bacterium PH28_bin88]|nr:hypothetical protein SY88_03315 [Clostridiales bacterium PH28_bin88]
MCYILNKLQVFVDVVREQNFTRVAHQHFMTMVPARFFAETLGIRVSWDGKNRIVHMQDSEK